jgi:hypothetical protein
MAIGKAMALRQARGGEDGGGASNLQAGEIFKIEPGQIAAVEAMGASLPYGTRSGWGE